MNKNSRVKARINRKSLRTGKAEVISQNPRRNMQQIVVQGYNEKRVNFSRTVHCKIQPAKPSFPKPRRDAGYQPLALIKPTTPIPGEGEEAIPEVVEA